MWLAMVDVVSTTKSRFPENVGCAHPLYDNQFTEISLN